MARVQPIKLKLHEEVAIDTGTSREELIDRLEDAIPKMRRMYKYAHKPVCHEISEMIFTNEIVLISARLDI